MRTVSIAGRFVILAASFVVVTAATLLGLSYQLSRSTAANQRLAGEAQTRNTAVFGIINTVADVQNAGQKLVREKDPDAIEKLIAEAKACTQTARDKVAQIGDGSAAVSGALDKLARANEKVTATVLMGEYAPAQQLVIEESNPAFDELLKAITNLQQEEQRRTQQSAAEAAQSASRVLTVSFTLVGFATAGLLVAAVWVVRNISRALGGAVLELTQAAEQVAGGANRVSTSSQVLAEGSTEQAATLEQTSASAEEVNSIARLNADNSQAVAQLMLDTAKTVQDANQRLDQMVASMTDIGASSGKISKIIKVIDEIAFQTNILALNAAVEAARAGEAGAGFAVVADEVRSLAQRSAKAAAETAALIQDSVKTAGEGNLRLGRVADAMLSVTDAAAKAKSLVDELTVSAREQTRGMNEIARAVSQMQEATQKSAGSAEQGATAGRELSTQSQVLRDIVTRLDRLVNGARRE